MGIDLHGAGGYFRFGLVEWENTLNLAGIWGWEPAGVVLLDPKSKERFCPPVQLSGYMSTGGQRVPADDAAAIGDALERFLNDIPDGHSDVGAWARAKVDSLLLSADGARQVASALELVVGSFGADPGLKTRLRKFVTYCRAGEFRVL